MPRSMFSSSWYRVADLKPRLRGHAVTHRQVVRDQLWYVLEDRASGRYHRFTPEANLIVGQLDGTRTVNEIWEAAAEHLGDDTPTQDEVIQLLSQLHGADLLNADVTPDVDELAERSKKMRRMTLLQHFKNPMAIRLPLLDPDRFLTATVAFVRPLFTPVGFLLWLALIVFAVAQAGQHWSELTENLTDRVLTAGNIALLLLTYPVIKALHELGHGYAAKSFGGEVHDMGIMFLVFMPLPYVDASSSSAFRSKWKRATVAAAGIMVEMSLAALALVVWLLVEPGIVRACAFNVMLIAGLSTLLFNGNPLLRYDGYYVMADAIEMPNLATRSNKYFFYLIQRYAFDMKEAMSPPAAPDERGWLFIYAIASFLYRTFIMMVIVLFVAANFFFIGVILAIWSAASMFLIPLGKGVLFVLKDPQVRRRRNRAITVCVATVGAVVAFMFLVPMPYGTVVKGAVWVPDNAIVYAGATGVVDRIVADPNSTVAADQPLIELRDPFIESRLKVAEAEIREYAARLAAVRFADPVQANIIREQLGHARARRDNLREQIARLIVTSEAEGRFILQVADDLIGRFVNKGDVLGYVADTRNPIVRVAIPQDDIDPVRNRMQGAAIRFVGNTGDTYKATIRRVTPAASNQLSNRTLSTEGGGDIAMDPTDPSRTLDKVFQLDLSIPAAADAKLVGSRVFVRFDHGSEPLAYRTYRRLRQLFLSHFSV